MIHIDILLRRAYKIMKAVFRHPNPAFFSQRLLLAIIKKNLVLTVFHYHG